MKNNNCPICGSTGDDLVFKFYCSNDKCANHVPNNREQAKKIYTIEKLNFDDYPIGTHNKCIFCEEEERRNKNNDIFDWFENDNSLFSVSVKKQLNFLNNSVDTHQDQFNFDTHQDFEHIRKSMIEALKVPKEYFSSPGVWKTAQEITPSPLLVPGFEISLSELGMYADLKCCWKSKVPQILETLTEPILDNAWGNIEIATKKINKTLWHLSNRGELTWNGYNACWEIHCVE